MQPASRQQMLIAMQPTTFIFSTYISEVQKENVVLIGSARKILTNGKKLSQIDQHNYRRVVYKNRISELLVRTSKRSDLANLN